MMRSLDETTRKKNPEIYPLFLYPNFVGKFLTKNWKSQTAGLETSLTLKGFRLIDICQYIP